MAYKTSNPALSAKTFDKFPWHTSDSQSMTLEGTSSKCMLLLLLTTGGAFASWALGLGMFYCLIGALVAFVCAIVYIFNQKLVFLAPTYAILEGLALGGVSALYEKQYPGIVINAVVLTIGTLATMLFLYRARVIKVTENFKMGVVAATGGVCVLYIIDLLCMSFGHPIAFIHQGGWAGILFSLLVVGLAALNLVMDFDFIEKGVERGAPKYMEWYGAFGLIVTLVWLYLELLRLIAKIRS